MACIIGGITSIVMVYAWYGIAVQQSDGSNDSVINGGNGYHWISFVFMTFHQASVEGNFKNYHP